MPAAELAAAIDTAPLRPGLSRWLLLGCLAITTLNLLLASSLLGDETTFKSAPFWLLVASATMAALGASFVMRELRRADNLGFVLHVLTSELIGDLSTNSQGRDFQTRGMQLLDASIDLLDEFGEYAVAEIVRYRRAQIAEELRAPARTAPGTRATSPTGGTEPRSRDLPEYLQ